MVDDNGRRHPPWPWRSDPGSAFNTVATFARLTAGFEARLYGVDDSEYIAEPELIARDSILLLVMAIRRARRAGFDLDLERLIAMARAEADRWERTGNLPPEPT